MPDERGGCLYKNNGIHSSSMAMEQLCNKFSTLKQATETIIHDGINSKKQLVIVRVALSRTTTPKTRVIKQEINDEFYPFKNLNTSFKICTNSMDTSPENKSRQNITGKLDKKKATWMQVNFSTRVFISEQKEK